MKITAYHYSSEKFESFNDEKIGSNVDDGYFGRGFYFWSSKKEAKKYGKSFGKYIYSVDLDINAYVIDLNGDIESLIKDIGFDAKKEADFLNCIELNGVDELYACGWFECSGIEKILAKRGFNAIIVKNRRDISCDEICVFAGADISIKKVEKI